MAIRKRGAEQIVNSPDTENQREPAVAGLEGGGFAIAWENDASIGVVRRQGSRIYDAEGASVAGPLIIDGAGQLDVNPAVAGLADGGFVTVFSTGNARTYYSADFRRFAADGQQTGARGETSTLFSFGGNIFETELAATNAGFAAVWDDSGVITLKLYDQAFASASGRVPVSAISGGPADRAADIAATSSGRLAVTWIDGATSFVQLRVFNADLSPATGDIAVGSAKDFSVPKITTLSNGRLAVVWNAEGTPSTGDASGQQVLVRIYEPDGAVVTGPILVNSTTAGDQREPTITALDHGRFLVAWVTPGLAANRSDVVAQLFEYDGRKIGGEFLVAGDLPGLIIQPDVATLEDGRVAVVFTGSDGPDRFGTAASPGIRLQLLDPRDDMIEGGVGNDALSGQEGFADEINGRGGQDTLFGLSGDDTLYGSTGDDALYGGSGLDELYGGPGRDDLVGGADGDRLDGGAGFDTVYYSSAPGRVVVDLADWALNQGEAAFDGYFDVEAFAGSNFDDVLRGDAGSQQLHGQGGADLIDGRAGVDGLTGGDGDDILIGGLGLDAMYGNAGADAFRYLSPQEGDAGELINDLVSGTDRIEVSALGFGGGLTPGPLLGPRLVYGSSATAPIGQFLYDGGLLSWDADGTGAGAAVAIAQLVGAPLLLASDILVI